MVTAIRESASPFFICLAVLFFSSPLFFPLPSFLSSFAISRLRSFHLLFPVDFVISPSLIDPYFTFYVSSKYFSVVKHVWLEMDHFCAPFDLVAFLFNALYVIDTMQASSYPRPR